MSHPKHLLSSCLQLLVGLPIITSGKIFWLSMLTANRLRKVLSYAPTTGIFRWKVVLALALLLALSPGQKMGGVTVKFVLVVGLIQQVALLGSI